MGNYRFPTPSVPYQYMSDNKQLFLIKNENDGAVAFYTELEKAKRALKSIYNETVNFKIYNYEINVYDLIDDEYVITNVTYTYRFDIFLSNTH